MSYQLEITRRAQRALAQIQRRDFDRIREAIRGLSSEPRPPGCKKLTGREAWRIRIGRYRVIYEIEDTVRVVTVVEVGHRREVYRR